MLHAIALALIASFAPPQQSYDVYDLPAGRTAGIKVGYPGWAANKVSLPNPKAAGHRGLVIRGQGIDQSFLALDNWGASLLIGNDCGEIIVRDCTIVGAKDFGIKSQSERGEWEPRIDPATGVKTMVYVEKRSQHYDTSQLTLVNVRFVLEKHQTTWLVHTNGVDHWWSHVEIDASCAATREHMLYAHGVAKRGIWLDHVQGHGIGAEWVKVATRPFEAFFVPDALLYIGHSYFSNFGQPTSNWTGGGGVILQGSALAHIRIDRTVIAGRMDGTQPKDKLIGISDGLSTIRNAANNQRRAYDVLTGLEAGDAPAGWCANGTVEITNSALLGFSASAPVQTLSLYPNYQSLGIAQHFEAVSWTMTNVVALDGNGSTNGVADVRLRDIKDDAISVQGCNDPRYLRVTSNVLGWPIDEEMVLSSSVGNGPLSKGFGQ